MSQHDITRRPPTLHESETTDRVFHAVTNCPRDLRRHLLINGEPTAEVDMAGAQFFLLLGLYPKGSSERAGFAALVRADIYRSLFAEVCRAGEGGAWGGTVEAWDRTGGESLREAFKVYAIRKILYERLYPDTARNPVWCAFLQLSPELAVLVATKRATCGAAKAFNCDMQRAEAELVLGHIVPRITREVSECRPVSIHDGILCQRRLAESVRLVMEEETARLYGERPRVRSKCDGA